MSLFRWRNSFVFCFKRFFDLSIFNFFTLVFCCCILRWSLPCRRTNGRIFKNLRRWRIEIILFYWGMKFFQSMNLILWLHFSLIESIKLITFDLEFTYNRVEEHFWSQVNRFFLFLYHLITQFTLIHICIRQSAFVEEKVTSIWNGSWREQRRESMRRLNFGVWLC